MGFLKKLFGNVEKVNKGEIPAEEIIPPFANDLAEEADDYWRQMEQNLLINAVKAVGGPDKADRAFMLVNFKPGQETFDLYYQVDGNLISWQELDPELVEKSAFNSCLKPQLYPMQSMKITKLPMFL